MVATRQAGFTIVEITLFLAITSLLFLVALTGVDSAIRTVRFTDTGRSFEAFVQKQYDDIVSGLNNRDNTISCNAGVVDTSSGQGVGTSNCLLIGKLIVFRQNQGQATTYNVIGTEPANVNYALSDADLVAAFNPRTVTQAATTTYTLPWGARVSGFKRTTDNIATNGLLLIRSPKSARILSYTFVVPTAVPINLSSVVGAQANLARPTNFCIQSADTTGAPARLVVDGGATQDAVRIRFDSVEGDCNGV